MQLYSVDFLQPLAQEILGPHVKVWCLGRGRDTGNLMIIKLAVGSEVNQDFNPTDLDDITKQPKQKPYKIMEKTISVLGGESEEWYRVRFTQLREVMPHEDFWHVPEDYAPKPLKPAERVRGAAAQRQPYQPGGVMPIYAKSDMATIAPENIAPSKGPFNVDMGTVKDTGMGTGIDYGRSTSGVAASGSAPATAVPDSSDIDDDSPPLTPKQVTNALSKIARTMVGLEKELKKVVNERRSALIE